MNKTSHDHSGYDHCGKYKYNDIKNFKHCCGCKYFFDNELETRFECEKESREDDCYESKFEDYAYFKR